jgi:hypothetical protein
MIGFDVARSASPPEQLGTASGIVNVGAFLASAITLLATGFLVDATGAEHTASATAALEGFKVAFCFPYVLLALGSWQIMRLSRSIRSDNRVALLRSSVDYHSVGPTSPVARSVTIDG